MRQARPLLLLAAALAVAACSSHPSPYQRAMDAAAASARQARTAEASSHYREAAQRAPNAELAVEARYREATMWSRAGKLERALSLLEELAAEEPRASRMPRVWLDIGRLRAKVGDQAGARAAYRQVLAHPESGLATRAADALAAETAGEPASVYRALLPLARGRAPLDAFLRLRVAQAEARAGDLGAAIATAEELARRHPLPIGAYTDDALLLAARARRALGDTSGALAVIDAFLAAEEKSTLVGSYERPTYAEARWLAADIHQVDRGDGRRAEDFLEDLVRKDDTSRLRDDALFRAAWLAHHDGRSDVACARVRRLAQLDPPSPLAACAGLVCPSASSSSELESRRCLRAASMAEGAPSSPLFEENTVTDDATPPLATGPTEDEDSPP